MYDGIHIEIDGPPLGDGTLITGFTPDELERRFNSPRRQQKLDPDRRSRDQRPVTSSARCDLRLYVSSESVNCSRATSALRSLVGHLPSKELRLQIIDVAVAVDAATQDRILFTPTLILRNGSGHVTRFLGDLSNPVLLLEMLRDAGVTSI
jgi:hypothetical protein